jgi:hypothetical protein
MIVLQYLQLRLIFLFSTLVLRSKTYSSVVKHTPKLSLCASMYYVAAKKHVAIIVGTVPSVQARYTRTTQNEGNIFLALDNVDILQLQIDIRPTKWRKFQDSQKLLAWFSFYEQT